MIVFFDVETNGFIKDPKAPLADFSSFPRITQLAYSIYDRKGNRVKSYSSLIKPEDWTIPKERFFIENNHSTERCEKEGIPIRDVLNTFVLDMKQVDIMVAFNLDFDSKILAVEMIRLGLKIDKKQKFCAMLKAMEILKIPNTNPRYPNKYKFPKLQEAYNFFNGNNFDGNHDALADVDATANIFFNMVKRGDVIL